MSAPRWLYVDGSTMIAAFAHDGRDEMRVMFENNGAIYAYAPVAPTVMLEIVNAPSIGHAFHKFTALHKKAGRACTQLEAATFNERKTSARWKTALLDLARKTGALPDAPPPPSFDPEPFAIAHLVLQRVERLRTLLGTAQRAAPRVDPRSAAGTLCSVCGEPQYKTPSGDVCENGHGGAPAKEDN